MGMAETHSHPPAAVRLFAITGLSCTVLSAGLTVTEVPEPPAPEKIRIQQTERDETGPTSFRYYAPREGKPTKTDEWVYKMKDGKPDGTVAKYYYRDRDLGQVFKTGKEGFKLGAVTVRLQPVDVAGADPAGAKVSVQIMKVTGKPVINHNGTTAKRAPNGTSKFKKEDVTNAQWSTYATDWPYDKNDINTPHRWPVMHYSDDFIEGETYGQIAVASGGIVPEGLDTNDYMRWEFTGESSIQLEPETTYAILFMFDEPAAPGVNRNIPLSNINVVPNGNLADPYPDGHAIRRDGSSTKLEEVFIYDETDEPDVAASKTSSSFPAEMEKRLAIQPGTIGYPDVYTYRDLYFIIEAAE